ncbi:Copper resistance protein CopC [Pragia fontium]|uniref:copper homeostasis periplasmic binding protein CopC n=1 Tax=Pragia fontium TaxID=82985 RepID=UPI000E078C8C|nr:copper homeostasis periplasmic binding protein CopC [Pragia fontium]SUB82060.1 Copper resistance protein CopC [Pragia fontium]
MVMPQLRNVFHLFSIALIFIFGLTSQQAMAHAHLKLQSPEADTTVSSSPADISLTFSEGVELKFSKITLIGSDKKAIETGTLALDTNDNTRIMTTIKQPLSAGQYTVNWQVVSVDGHKTKGSYHFSVKP